MVTSFLLDLLDRVVAWMLSGLGESPDWLDGLGVDGAARIQDVLDQVARWGFLVPFDTLNVVFPIALAGWGISITIRLVRIVASYLTLGGGM